MQRPMLIALTFAMVTFSGCVGNNTASTSEGMTPLCLDPCTWPVDDSQTRTFESSIARNPLDLDNILVGASFWRGTNDESGPADIEYHVSFDGGNTFTTSEFPGDVAPDHPLAFADTFADPQVLFLEDGTALFSAMAGRGAQPEDRDLLLPAFESFDLVVARSSDGGLTWPEAVLVSDTPGLTGIQNAGTMTDQPFMTVAPNGHIFMQWILIEYEADGSVAGQNVASSKSPDGGKTWSDVVMVTSDGTSRGGRAAISDNGHIAIALRDTSGTGIARPLELAHSTDDGATWTIEPLPGWKSIQPTQMTHWGNDLLLAFGNPDANHVETITLARSTDGGYSWEVDEIARSKQPGPSIPNVVATSSGAVFVTYYLTDADGHPTAMATRLMPDGHRSDATLSNPLEPSIYGGIQGWPTYGDYSGVWADESGVIASWLGGIAPDTDLMWTILQESNTA